jgi:hypothetical protein
MKDKIRNSLDSIVLSDSQKEKIYSSVTKNNNLGGFILKICALTSCFILAFTLFFNKTNVDDGVSSYGCSECRTVEREIENEES